MDGFEKVCTEKHKAIDNELTRHSKWLEGHEKKIDNLERSDASNTTQIDNLTRAIGGQTKAIWGLIVSLLFVFVGFFIWYIQTL